MKKINYTNIKFGYKKLVKLLSLMLIVFGFNNIYAKDFYNYPNIIKYISVQIDKSDLILEEQFNYINTITNNIDNTKINKTLLDEDIKKFKLIFKAENIRQYTIQKYINLIKNQNDLDYYKSGYQIIKDKDLKTSISPYYLISLEKIFLNNPHFSENANLFKAYVYILYELEKNNFFDTKDYSFTNINKIINSDNFKKKVDSYKIYFDELEKKEEINKFSKNDFYKIYSTLVKENISSDSNYFYAFLYWYSKYKKILFNEYLFVSTNIGHSKQTKLLSCEANSTKDLINYYKIKYNGELVNEQNIIDGFLFTGNSLQNVDGKLIWGDPNEKFVGDINGKQTKIIKKFTGYGIYANPLLKIINKYINSYGLQVKKDKFSQKNIIESLASGSPVIFWYLLPYKKTKDGFKYITNPITWLTENGKNINGYIGQHSGLIVGANIDINGNIKNLYYYEGTTTDLQVNTFEEINKTALIFNEIIYAKKR